MAGLPLRFFVGLMDSFVGLRSNPLVRLRLNSFGPLLGCACILLLVLRQNSFGRAAHKMFLVGLRLKYCHARR